MPKLDLTLIFSPAHVLMSLAMSNESGDLSESNMSQPPSQSQSAMDSVPPVSMSTIPPVPGSKNKLFVIIAVVALFVFFTAVAHYLVEKDPKVDVIPNEVPPEEQPTNVLVPTKTVPEAPLFSGQIKRLNQNLGIFKSTEGNLAYYEAGKFNQGELKDYTRIIAINSSSGPGRPLTFTLATKDFQSYFLDDPDGKTTKYPEDDWQNPYEFLDKSKIVSTKIFETEQPKEIVLDQNFALHLEYFPAEIVPTDQRDKNGNQIYGTELTTDFTSYQKLTSPFNNLTIYFKPYEKEYGPDDTYYSKLSQEEKEEFLLRQKYLLGDTEVIVVDSVGLPIVYSMTTTEHAYPPTLGFSGSQINSQNKLKFFNGYGTAFPSPCALSPNSRVVNVRDDELEQIGSVSNLPLYRLKDTNHPLYSLAYRNKFSYYDEFPESWDLDNKGIQKPTLEQYVSQNPLLFIKNYWQQWVAVGESYIKIPVGCAKPVVYLYPTQPTDISVQFQVPVQFTTDIPKYAGSWKVRAYPDGSLVNLKPQFTDCRQFSVQQKGAEYAELACRNNTYPYLYWAGNVISKNYPVITKGWIVKREELSSFLNSKLIDMGLNSKERNDFTSYWLADMLEKNAPYYRVSFLQTEDLNMLFPMAVDPRPDTTFRIFLDYLALTEKPKQLPQPQNLNRLVRNGFTLVEWGGLKRVADNPTLDLSL